MIPRSYTAGMCVNCEIVNTRLEAVNSDASDKKKFVAAFKAGHLEDAPRTTIPFR